MGSRTTDSQSKGVRTPGIQNPSQYGSANTWESESKSVWIRKYLGCRIQVNMVPRIPGVQNPSQYGTANTWGAESKSIWFRKYLGSGIQVNMVPKIPGVRNPSQYGSENTWGPLLAPFGPFRFLNNCWWVLQSGNDLGGRVTRTNGVQEKGEGT